MLKHTVMAILLVTCGLAAGEASDPELALKKLRAAPGLSVSLFAAEPDVVGPIGLCVDHRGRVFVSETRRYNTAALYVKQRSHWYYDDLACRIVEDRIAMARKFMGETFSQLTQHSELVRMLEDRSGAGKADRCVVFADGFNSAADGCASGVVARGDTVWLTNVPNLWKLRDTDGDGKADERNILQTGYGTRFGNSGHDLHGPVFGPDGKLYFSMGDRGLHVETEGKIFAYPDTGAVLRCNGDGSEFEVFAYGLRNPQGLAFDDFGNLWTGDNNMDAGDEARWVQVVDGGDSGWRTGFQYATDPWSHVPIKVGHPLLISRQSTWILEELWKGRAPYVVPPVGYISKGPCGLTHYPGTGLPERYNGYFFLCDFPGGIHAFGVKPKGATYEIQDAHPFLWELWPTDAKFGPDGHLYVCDWVYGFPMNGKGRVFRVFDADAVRGARVTETRALLKDGMGHREAGTLVQLLGHRDQRVRQEAQFELARRKAVAELSAALGAEKSQLARLHAIWGLGQLRAAQPVLPLLNDADAEVRTQAARVLGEMRSKDALLALIQTLQDAQPRVRMHAALALGRVAEKAALAPLLELLRENGDDAFLRHAAVMGLVGSGDTDGLLQASRDPSARVRMGVLLALRRLKHAAIQDFLSDADPALVLEAARAINDVPIESGQPALAAKLDDPNLPAGAVLRAINASFRLGTPADAERLTRFAQRTDADAKLRAEALGALGGWRNPSQRDRVEGGWRPPAAREAGAAVRALAAHVPALLNDTAEEVQAATIRTAVLLDLRDAGAQLEGIAGQTARAGAVRIEALRAVTALRTPGFESVVSAAINAADAAVRKEGIALVPQLKSPEAVDALVRLVGSDAADGLRQTAIVALGRIEGEKSEQALAGLVDQCAAGGLKAALALDVLEAAAKKPALKARLEKYEAGLPQDDPVAAYKVCLDGGDYARGKKVFYENAEAACLRCHRINAEGGDVGPRLNLVGAQRSRLEILESILLPNKVVVQGYGQELLITKSSGPQLGRIKSEDAAEVVLVLPDGTERRIAKTDIRKRAPALSAMPEDMGKLLSKRDLRDLVAYLSALK